MTVWSTTINPSRKTHAASGFFDHAARAFMKVRTGKDADPTIKNMASGLERMANAMSLLALSIADVYDALRRVEGKR